MYVWPLFDASEMSMWPPPDHRAPSTHPHLNMSVFHCVQIRVFNLKRLVENFEKKCLLGFSCDLAHHKNVTKYVAYTKPIISQWTLNELARSQQFIAWNCCRYLSMMNREDNSPFSDMKLQKSYIHEQKTLHTYHWAPSTFQRLSEHVPCAKGPLAPAMPGTAGTDGFGKGKKIEIPKTENYTLGPS